MLEWHVVNTMETIYVGLFYLAAANLAAFMAMGIDKNRAKKNRWRIRESTLFLIVLLGGGPGGLAGMHVFRHKTRHWYFRYGFLTITLGEALIAGYFLTK